MVLGATATGKTALAIELARRFTGEVVNADSRYFYRGMDIGTAKPSIAERAGVPHHLLDIAAPTDDYSLATFLSSAYAAIEHVAACGHLPIVTGGTPQYLRALLEGWRAPSVAPDSAYRAALEREPAVMLHALLRSADPASAQRIDPRNKRRVIRALEIVRATGAPVDSAQGKEPPPYHWLLLGLRQDRERLRARIDTRVREMYAAGWLDEVRALRDAGATRDTPAMTAHGYREALAVLTGELTEDEAIARTQAMVRRYIRHQDTWFRRFEGVRWLDSADPAHTSAAIALTATFLAAP